MKTHMNRNLNRVTLGIAALLILGNSISRSQTDVPLNSSQLSAAARVAVIGDSITEQKLYSKYIEAYLLACTGRQDIKVFQYGWGGETAGGFAGRLQNDLAGFKPTVATLCYGMNDGQYRPYADDIGQNYEANMRKVITGLREIGVQKIIVGSPGAVDSKYFVNQRFAPLSGAEGYNQSLGKLRDIDRRLAAETGQIFADVHQPLMDAMAKAKAALGDDFDVCGRDGVHPGPDGQLVMAYAFLRAMGFDGNISAVVVDLNGSATVSAGHKVLRDTKGDLELESLRYPFCFDSDPRSASSTRSILPFVPFNQELNRFTLQVRNLNAAQAKVTWGTESKVFSREQLATGINLAAEFDRTPFDAQFHKLLEAIAAKQAFETTAIKGMITQFRPFKQLAQTDSALASAFSQVTERLDARQQQLDLAARQTIVPVKYVIQVTPAP
jgi:lysophospholipase L1-like esterase